VAPHRQPAESEPAEAEQAEERSSEPARRRRTSRPRPVAAAAPREEAAAPGTVVLRVNPWAEVFHGGKSLGLTPMDPVQVAAGRQRFVLKNSQLGVEKSVEVKVPAGGRVVLKADLLE
jgi:serine/threonine-protein kinase